MGDSHTAGRPAPATVHAAELIRSRENLTTSRERVAVATARLEKFVVAEKRTITVDVAREDVRIVYDDLGPDDDRMTTTNDVDCGTHRSDAVVLFAEEIEIIRRWVPVERARLAITSIAATETVTGTVQIEHIEATVGVPEHNAEE